MLILAQFLLGCNPYLAEGFLQRGSYDNLDAFCDAVAQLYMEQIVPSIKTGLCAAVYTQVSDVEDEINGLMTYDRRVEKLTPEKMLPVAAALQEALG